MAHFISLKELSIVSGGLADIIPAGDTVEYDADYFERKRGTSPETVAFIKSIIQTIGAAFNHDPKPMVLKF